MLTEKQAWQKLADHFGEHIKLIKGGQEHVYDTSGICGTMDDIGIPKRLRDRMGDAIIEGQPACVVQGYVHRWPFTLDGHRSRLKFCLAQVARLTKTAHKRKKGKK